ncbi:uncharacterized protein BYT42DRAFT_580888 [Radiomyces spectabilis]|uniref:uncharacterized protein n=1 Tax=Radiomyces spectabilis TaxID=64574 RepID=UPI00221EA46F|nr:uncharacterized protein BYT42DRAFT_580888 [Radiomyces spectabilis]KAI8371621.1 hypothetical protein BYT42DRAFT_580888 [Radiomyces spectabilis]
MKVSSAVIPLLFGILNAVFAQSQENDDCFITAPMQGTILKIGEQITVSWSSAHDAKFNAITLTRKGPKVGAAQNDNSHNIKYVGSDVDTAPGKFTFALSPDFAPSDDYYLTLGEGLHECTVGPLRLMPGK